MPKKLKADQEIVDDCNDLARKFYSDMGYVAPDGFKFYESRHPQEQSVWNLATIAYDHIEGTEVDQALTAVQEE